jgi:hypothetical protein
LTPSGLDEELCACGKPKLHYHSPRAQKATEQLVAAMGEHLEVAVGQRVFKVPRHYIAQHGLDTNQLPDGPFPEIPRTAPWDQQPRA